MNNQTTHKNQKKKSRSLRTKFTLRIPMCLSMWHRTFENHNHKTGIYSQGSGSTSVSLVWKQQLPTGQSWAKRHESPSANMSEPESFLKKEPVSECTQPGLLSARSLQSPVKAELLGVQRQPCGPQHANDHRPWSRMHCLKKTRLAFLWFLFLFNSFSCWGSGT